MAKDVDMGGVGAKGDHLKYYCIVFGILVVVIGIVALRQRSTLEAFTTSNKQAHNMLNAQGKSPQGRPYGMGDLAVEVEKFVQGYKKSMGGAAGSTGEGISTKMIESAGFEVQMKYTYASGEQDDPNRTKGFRTRSREFTYPPSTLEQLSKLLYNIEALGRYRVYEMRWKLADKKVNTDPPFNRVTKPVIKVGYRSPLTRDTTR